MKSTMKFENLSSSERNARAAIGTFTVIAAMESSLVGSPAFAAINILAIALVTSAIIGWDPIKSLFSSASRSLFSHKVGLPKQHV